MNAYANPADGTVVGGAVNISTSGSTLTINQSTDRAIINWNSFSIANGETTQFIQPSSTSAVLNRVTGANLSQIYGTLSSNGAVYLINPNGILIGSSGAINTQGGFVASTHDVTNGDFLSGSDLTFSGNSSAAIINLGKIGVDNGDVFLIARQVTNSGTITAPNGEVGLAGATQVLLKTYGSDKMTILPASSSGAIENTTTGVIKAATASLQAVGGNEYALAINNGGAIRAEGVAKSNGRVLLLATNGTTKNTGTITAANADGKGGFIETSGESVSIGGTIQTGEGGQWLIDPTYTNIDSAAAATLVSALTAGTTVTDSAADISVTAPITWTTTGALSLIATNTINIGADITATNGGLTLSAAAGSLASPTITNTGNIDVRTFTLAQGTWSQIAASLSTFSATNFVLNGGTFLRATSGDGSSSTPYLLADVYGLQGIASPSNTLLSKNFKLANNINASGTSSWNSGAGFTPIGSASNPFTGTFDGDSHSISGLYINNTALDNVGFFGFAQDASFSNVSLTNVNIAGKKNVGGFIGQNLVQNGSSTIQNVSVSGAVNLSATGATSSVGGLIGYNYALGTNAGTQTATISNSHSSATITANGTTSTYAGGLIGYNRAYYGQNTISNSDATGNITAAATSDLLFVGGLIGFNQVENIGRISLLSTHADGNVNATSTGNFVYAGGLVGRQYAYYSTVSGTNHSYVINDSYTTGNVYAKGASYIKVGGLIGINEFTRTYGLTLGMNSVYATGDVTGEALNASTICLYVGGLIGHNFASAMNPADTYTINIDTAHASGNVEALGSGKYVYVGGLIGHNEINGQYGRSGVYVNNVYYTTGNVQAAGTDYVMVGGLVGYNYAVYSQSKAIISNASATGLVSNLTSGSNKNSGGLIGLNATGTSAFAGINDSTWDSTLTGQSNSIGFDNLSSASLTGVAGAASLNAYISNISDSYSALVSGPGSSSTMLIQQVLDSTIASATNSSTNFLSSSITAVSFDAQTATFSYTSLSNGSTAVSDGILHISTGTIDSDEQ